jgi:hypothetical protein
MGDPDTESLCRVSGLKVLKRLLRERHPGPAPE